MATASVTFLAVMVCTVLTIYLQRCFHLGKMYQQHGCLTPPRLLQKDRILGIGAFIESYRNIRTNTYLSLQQARFEKHGNTYSFKSLGVSVINTIDPENVQAMLAKNFGDFGIGPRRKAAFDPLIGHGIFTADGSEWQAARKLIRPSLNRREIYDVSMFEEHVDRFLRHIPMEGTPVDLQDLFLRFTIDVATEFLFGQSLLTLIGCESLSGKITGADFACAFNRAQRSIADFFALGGLAFLIPKAQFRKDRTVVREFVDHYIKKALSTHSSDENKGADSGKSHGRYQFLQELPKQSADHEALRGGTLHLLLAGRDSTASLLSNMWFMLSRHPHVWKRLQDEIATLKGMKPTYERLKQLQYLRHCINESLRLHPVVPINFRTALRDTVLPVGGGPAGQSPIAIPSGTLIGYSCYAMHRRTDIYGPDAHEFKPERWDTIRPGWAYVPFSGGPRICLGQQFAINEASYLTARICQEFDGIESLDEEQPWREDLSLTCGSKDGCWVSLWPRQRIQGRAETTR